MNTAEINLPAYEFLDLLSWDATEFYWWLADTVDKDNGNVYFSSVHQALMCYSIHVKRQERKYGDWILDFHHSTIGRKHIAYRRKLYRNKAVKKKTYSVNNLLCKD